MPKHERDSMISISIVSHGQGALVQRLLADLAQFCGLDTEVILTENIPEPAPGPYLFAASPLKIVKNNAPRGFGANHNEAFRHAVGEYFCVLNPDVRLPLNPFPALLSELESRSVGVVAPLIVNTNGDVEDSARRFPTPFSLFSKALRRGVRVDYPQAEESFSPDWVAGMFMLFRREAFERVGGFDERYFLYYEDVDLCARLRLAEYRVRMVPRVRAVHEAQRRSHRNLRHLAWHVRSVARFFLSAAYAEVMRRR